MEIRGEAKMKRRVKSGSSAFAGACSLLFFSFIFFFLHGCSPLASAPVLYTLALESDGNGTANPIGTTRVVKGAAMTITATANAGYSFKRWIVLDGPATIGDAYASGTEITLSDGDATIQANFVNDDLVYRYIDPDGVDSADRDGNIGSEWRSLGYACGRASSDKTVIHVNAGIYTETTKSALATGVSLEGTGDTSRIILTYAVDDIRYAPIELKSPAQGTLGNQSISRIRFDGGALTAIKAIAVFARSNISIHHCTFTDFKRSAIELIGTDQSNTPVGNINIVGTEPTTYATGNTIHDNTFLNCSGYYGYGTGAVDFSGQDGLNISGNRFDGTSRTAAENGWFLKCYEFFKNCRIHDNTADRTHGAPSNILMELWDSKGGNEVDNNTLHGGCIDIAGHFSVKGSSQYSYDVHHNIMTQTGANIGKGTGIVVEGGAQDVLIRNNYVKGFSILYGSTINQDNLTLRNINIHYNLFIDAGLNGAASGQAFIFGGSKATSTMTEIHISNNVIYQDASWPFKPLYAFFWYMGNGTYTNFHIRNNIIQGFTEKGYSRASPDSSGVTPAPVFDWVSVENNLIYGNGNGNNPWYTGVLMPAHGVNAANISSDPEFVNPGTDFHLQSGSPAIRQGQDVGLTNDYDGAAVSNPPNIGAFE
jgi:hypothetical protein